jgi:deoxyribodipyrimidine photolyase-like uncharacterized protein
MIYTLEPEQLYRENQMKHYNKLSESFWRGSTNILIIDQHIEMLNKTAYLHHIARLMIFGGFMLLL